MKTSKLFRLVYILIACFIPLLFFSFMFQAEEADYYNERIILYDSLDVTNATKTIKINYFEGDTAYIHKELTPDSLLISIVRYKNAEKKEKIGESKYYYMNGKLKRTENYNNSGKLHGYLVSYYQNGKRKRVDKYNNGELEIGKCFDSLGNKISYIPYYIEPDVDMAKIQELLKYPESLRGIGNGEDVKVRVLIDKTGTPLILDYNSKSSMGFIYEIKRILTLSIGIEPAYEDGEPVRCWVYMPFVFRLR